MSATWLKILCFNTSVEADVLSSPLFKEQTEVLSMQYLNKVTQD